MNWTELDLKNLQDRQRQDEPESALQKRIVDHCYTHGWPCHFHNQSQYYYRVHNRGEGWFDGVILHPRKLILVEIKKKKGRMRQAQTMIRNQCRHLGYETYKIKTWREFMEIIGHKKTGD